MSSGCKCSGCNTQHHYDEVRANNLTHNAHWANLAQAIIDPPTLGSGYQLTLSRPETEEGYFLKFVADIDIFQFTNLYNEFISRGSVELDYNEDEEL